MEDDEPRVDPRDPRQIMRAARRSRGLAGMITRLDEELLGDFRVRLWVPAAMFAAVVSFGWWGLLPFALLPLLDWRLIPHVGLWGIWACALLAFGPLRMTVIVAVVCLLYWMSRRR